MFGVLFKQKDSVKKDYKAIGRGLYGAALLNTRKEFFYKNHAVPDTFDGRFDLLLVHIFLILHRVMGVYDYKKISQATFDATFKDMDQTLREMGIGDVGVPKHLKRMMLAFNGRMHHYQMAVVPETLDKIAREELEPVSLHEALRRNLYGTLPDDAIDHDGIEKMKDFIRVNLSNNDENVIEALSNGRAVFINKE